MYSSLELLINLNRDINFQRRMPGTKSGIFDVRLKKQSKIPLYLCKNTLIFLIFHYFVDQQ